MANYFTLTPRGGDKPEAFALIDEKMCAALGVLPDPKLYYRYWYDNVGLGLAMGKTFDQLKEGMDPEDEYDAETIRIIDWLNANYVVDAWAGR